MFVGCQECYESYECGPPSAYNGPQSSYRPAYGLSTRLIPASASTGCFTSFQSGPAELKTFPRSVSTMCSRGRSPGLASDDRTILHYGAHDAAQGEFCGERQLQRSG